MIDPDLAGFIVFVIGIVVIALYIRKKGLLGAWYGGKNVQTFGEVEGEDLRTVRTTAKIHAMTRKGKPVVLIEFATYTLGKRRVHPLFISPHDAEQFSRLLGEASAKT